MYRIIHPMNNNVALAKHENGEEVVLIGSGIAFNKKKGDIVLESKIEKIFRLRTEESKHYLQKNFHKLSDKEMMFFSFNSW